MSIPQTGNKSEKSVKLSEEELKSLQTLRDNYNSFDRFSIGLGINRTSLIRIMQFCSGSEKNIKKIRRKLSRITSPTNA